MTDKTETQDPATETTSPKPKRVRGDAVKRLYKATARIVRDNCDKIAQTLLDCALSGDVSAAKLLVAFIEKEKSRKTTAKAEKEQLARANALRNLAKKWAAKPRGEDPPKPVSDDEVDDDEASEPEPENETHNTLVRR